MRKGYRGYGIPQELPPLSIITKAPEPLPEDLPPKVQEWMEELVPELKSSLVPEELSQDQDATANLSQKKWIEPDLTELNES